MRAIATRIQSRGVRVLRGCEAVGVRQADRGPSSQACRFDPDRLVRLCTVTPRAAIASRVVARLLLGTLPWGRRRRPRLPIGHGVMH